MILCCGLEPKYLPFIVICEPGAAEITLCDAVLNSVKTGRVISISLKIEQSLTCHSHGLRNILISSRLIQNK
jgi:hypothetical protein